MKVCSLKCPMNFTEKMPETFTYFVPQFVSVCMHVRVYIYMLSVLHIFVYQYTAQVTISWLFLSAC